MIETRVTVWCDGGCGSYTDGGYLVEAIGSALDQRWRIDGDRHLCPRCAPGEEG